MRCAFSQLPFFARYRVTPTCLLGSSLPLGIMGTWSLVPTGRVLWASGCSQTAQGGGLRLLTSGPLLPEPCGAVAEIYLPGSCARGRRAAQ